MGDYFFLASAGATLNADLVPIYYIVGILALVAGGLWTLKNYANQQKKTNIDQGVKEQQLADRLDANTKAADKNTASIEKLGDKFDTFSSAMDKRMTLIDYRVDQLERDVKDCKDKVRGNGNVQDR